MSSSRPADRTQTIGAFFSSLFMATARRSGMDKDPSGGTVGRYNVVVEYPGQGAKSVSCVEDDIQVAVLTVYAILRDAGTRPRGLSGCDRRRGASVVASVSCTVRTTRVKAEQIRCALRERVPVGGSIRISRAEHA